MKRWSVLFGCFVGMGIATPAILLVPMGLFLKSMTAEFGWTRTEFAMLISIAALFNALTMPVAGYLVDRFGAPKVIAAGTVLGCCAYAGLSLATSFVSFVAILAVAVMMGSLASYPAFMGLAQRWFDKNLGLALAVTSTGLAVGVGGFSYLIAETIDLQGWRTAFVAAGAVALAVGVMNLILFVRINPGPLPEAERRPRTHGEDEGASTLGEALRTRDFWLYAVAFGLVIFGVVGCNAHLPAMLSDRGASAAQIASIVAIGAGGSLFGRLTTGILLDRFAVRAVAGVFLLGQAVGFLLLLQGMQWALLASFLLGAVQGAEIDILGYVIARRFARKAYARIFGTCFALTLVGAITGPIAMAAIFDGTGSYGAGLAALPVLPVLAFGLLCLAGFAPRVAPSLAEPAKA